MATFMQRFIDWLTQKRAPFSYGVTDDRDGEFIVEAHKFSLDADGRLLFWKRGWLFQRVVSVVEAGKWQRVQEGIRLEDLEKL